MRRTDDALQGTPDIESAVRNAVLIVFRKWWVVVLVVAVTVGVPSLFSARTVATYEARTKLLIIAPASEQLLGEGGAPVLNLSVETLSALATANDLMQAIINELDLADSARRPWAVESLAGMLDPEVELSGVGTQLPLITTTVRGDDPELVARIANKWAESFARKNSELFATEAAGLYEFVSSQYQNDQQALSAVQAERLTYGQARQADRLTYVQTRQADRLEYEQTRQTERLTEQQARRQEGLALERGTPLTSLKSRLDVIAAKYSDFLAELQAKRSALVAAGARLGSVREALAGQQPFLTYERRMSSDAIWSIAAGNPGGLAEEALSDLVMEDQERNDLYVALNGEHASLQSEVASLTAEILHLETRTEEFEREIEDLTGQIGETELGLLEFDQATTDMLTRFDQGTSAELLRFDQETAAELARLDGDTSLTVSQLDQETAALNSNLDRLVQNVQEAGMAKAEQAGSIRIVESAVVPRSALSAGRGRTQVAALVIFGLVLGVAAAFAVHFAWGVFRPGGDTQQRLPPEEAS